MWVFSRDDGKQVGFTTERRRILGRSIRATLESVCLLVGRGGTNDKTCVRLAEHNVCKKIIDKIYCRLLRMRGHLVPSHEPVKADMVDATCLSKLIHVSVHA